MAQLNVYWKMRQWDNDEMDTVAREDVKTGILTNEHESATDETPVLVEEVTSRVYYPGDLPPETVLYIESAPDVFPELAEQARQAGYQIEHA